MRRVPFSIHSTFTHKRKHFILLNAYIVGPGRFEKMQHESIFYIELLQYQPKIDFDRINNCKNQDKYHELSARGLLTGMTVFRGIKRVYFLRYRHGNIHFDRKLFFSQCTVNQDHCCYICIFKPSVVVKPIRRGVRGTRGK